MWFSGTWHGGQGCGCCHWKVSASQWSWRALGAWSQHHARFLLSQPTNSFLPLCLAVCSFFRLLIQMMRNCNTRGAQRYWRRIECGRTFQRLEFPVLFCCSQAHTGQAYKVQDLPFLCSISLGLPEPLTAKTEKTCDCRLLGETRGDSCNTGQGGMAAHWWHCLLW